MGMANDPRGKGEARKELERAKKEHEQLDREARKEFDQERLTNPYSDTRLLNGDPGVTVKRILLGIDIGVGELLMVDRLRERTGPIDAVVAHHPGGGALAGLHEVMAMQADIFSGVGVPIAAAEGLLDPRMEEVNRRVMPVNHTRAVDAARLLGIPLVCVHTPADNCVSSHLQRLFDRKRPRTLGDVVTAVKGLDEYSQALAWKSGPQIVVGSARKRAGKVFVDMAGGTGGPEKIIGRLSQAGIGTVVGMHFSEKFIEEAKKNQVNLVVAGHMASDSLGLNLLLGAVLKGKSVDVVACSGFIRVKRGQG